MITGGLDLAAQAKGLVMAELSGSAQLPSFTQINRISVEEPNRFQP
jgi:hypothetical protein